MMKRILLFCIASSIFVSTGLAQSTSEARAFLESRLTKPPHLFDNKQSFRFADPPYPDHFTIVQQNIENYVESRIRLSDIAAIDIISVDTTVALLLTLHKPILALLRQDLFGRTTDTIAQQSVTLPLHSYKEAAMARRMFQVMNNRLDFRIRKQQADKSYPEMQPMPEIQARPAWLGKYPITVQQYRTYCHALEKPMPAAPPWGWHADHPVVGITWQEAKDYAFWLSRQTGHGYDLPPKHVWQYAALTKHSEKILDEIAWWGENAAESTQPVGQKLPNDFGLYDTLGNVWEWLDEPEENGQRAAAGGSWDSHFEHCQWYSTTCFLTDEHDLTVGFRVIRYDK